MINPTGDEFNEEVPTSASADVGAFQPRNRSAAETASEAWEQTKEKAGAMKTRTEIFVRQNPIPILLGALGVGIAIGARDPLRFNHSYQGRRATRENRRWRARFSFAAISVTAPEIGENESGRFGGRDQGRRRSFEER